MLVAEAGERRQKAKVKRKKRSGSQLLIKVVSASLLPFTFLLLPS
jgi:hypothetical protein